MERIFFEGFSLQAGLIFALGAQNIFVLEAGLKRRHQLLVSFVCFLCDLTLILLGVAGAATIFSLVPQLRILIGFAGAVFLFIYGVKKMTEVSFLSLKEDEKFCSIGRSALLAMTFSLINPHAYLDAFVLIGGYSAKYSSLDQRLMLGLGAAVYSGVWFLVLSSLAALVKPLLENQMRMRLISTLAGIFLIYLSGKLALDVLGGLPEISLIPWPKHAGELRLFTTVVI